MAAATAAAGPGAGGAGVAGPVGAGPCSAVSVFPGARLLTIGDANGEIQRHAEQQALRLEVRAGPDAAGIALYSHEDVCVFKCSVSRETECSRCSRVGKQSFIITLGCNSVLIQFATPNDFCSFYNILKTCRGHTLERSVFSERTEESSAVQYFQRPWALRLRHDCGPAACWPRRRLAVQGASGPSLPTPKQARQPPDWPAHASREPRATPAISCPGVWGTVSGMKVVV
uniref:Coactivator associated arginine methyltransferase 1 n=1 Tax=Equus asinus asinus TaxID=83772 RepID=A0A8C4LJ00_EQUAS